MLKVILENTGLSKYYQLYVLNGEKGLTECLGGLVKGTPRVTDKAKLVQPVLFSASVVAAILLDELETEPGAKKKLAEFSPA